MRCQLGKRNLEKGKGRMISDKTKDARRPERDERRPKPPRGRFMSFTPLTAPVDQVLMQIKDEEALTYPGKLKGDPNRHSKD